MTNTALLCLDYVLGVLGRPAVVRRDERGVVSTEVAIWIAIGAAIAIALGLILWPKIQGYVDNVPDDVDPTG